MRSMINGCINWAIQDPPLNHNFPEKLHMAISKPPYSLHPKETVSLLIVFSTK